MAIQKTMSFRNNFGEMSVFENAYIRVEEVSGGKSNATAHIKVWREKDSGFIVNMHKDFVPSMDGDNFIKQAYEYLKTLPEFADATDI